MPPGAGSRIGPYEIAAKLGEGGMGAVYRARDTKLNRDVAIKLLSDAVLSDPDRIARFQREAQVLASLNHPNIAHLYGFEDGETPCLVMELVEGPTLAERIDGAPGLQTGGTSPEAKASGLQLDEVLAIGRQIAEALEAAHDQGIIHRDLKPANVKVKDDGTVKVLDFGLAKALTGESSASSAGAMNSPTLTARATQLGVILGTAAYMSPEQAKGKAVDRRADIWAFGVVMHEMLTGDRPFKGEDISDTLAAVLRQEISFGALPSATPPRLKRLLERCLDRDVKTRLRDIGEARIELARLQAGDTGDAPLAAVAPSAPPPSPRRRILPWIVGVLVVAAASIATWVIMRPAPAPPAQLMRFAFVPSTTTPLSLLTNVERIIALSPGGTHVAYVTADGSLVVRPIDRLDAEPIRGITGARGPFFSYDGKWIGFFQGNDIRKVSVSGGPTVRICSFVGLPRGASWGPDDVIVFATSDISTGLQSVSSAGGEPKVLSKPDQAAIGGSDHLNPSVLPDGRILFTITVAQPENAQVAVLDPKTGAIKPLIPGGGQPEFVPFDFAHGVASESSQVGYLIYGVPGSLRAVRFDSSRLELLGDAVPVMDQVSTTSGAAANFAVSRTGTLVYVPGGLSTAGAERTLVWLDRQGHETPIKAEPRGYYTVRLSPDETRAVVDIRDRQNDVWVFNFARETLTPITFDPQIDGFAVWAPDNQHIVFSSQRVSPYNLYSQSADGTGAPVRLTTSNDQHVANTVLPDGRIVMTSRNGVNDDIGLWTKDKPEFTPLIHTAAPERNADVSPDGKWIAYESFETTPPQVYVQPFPDVSAGKWQMSKDGGVRPAWSKNGRELYYLSSSTGMTVSLYAVPIPTTPSSAGNPVKLFDVPNLSGQLNGRFYDVAKNGKFIFVKSAQPKDQAGSAMQTLVVVANWFEELKAKVLGK